MEVMGGAGATTGNYAAHSVKRWLSPVVAISTSLLLLLAALPAAVQAQGRPSGASKAPSSPPGTRATVAAVTAGRGAAAAPKPPQAGWTRGRAT